MNRAVHLALLAAMVAACGRERPVLTPPCPEPDSLAPWAVVSRSFRDTTGARWTNDSLRTVLLTLATRDQKARADFGARVNDPVYAKRLIALDSALALSVDTILDRFGLPTRSMVGAKGATAIMLVVQHNGRLQRKVLALAKTAPAGEVPLEAVAMMEDRLLVADKQSQVYGTQFNIESDGRMTFATTSDLGGLESRRAKVGLMPLPLYACMMLEAGMRIDTASLPH